MLSQRVQASYCAAATLLKHQHISTNFLRPSRRLGRVQTKTSISFTVKSTKPFAWHFPESRSRGISFLALRLRGTLCKSFKFGCGKKSRDQTAVQQPGRRAVNMMLAAYGLTLRDRERGGLIVEG